MTYYGGKELAAAFRTVRGNTIKIASEIPEEQYDFKPSPDVRSIRDTLAHIALSTFFPMHVHTNKLDDMKTINLQELMATMTAEHAKPRTKADIIELLQTEGEAFASSTKHERAPAETVTMLPGGSLR
jgi:uncharacterized damage-inducible protein DinB